MFPYIGADGALYFSSDGHGGLGGLDLYYSVQHQNTQKWAEPETLGAPFNSTSDDFGFIVDSENKNGYFSSDRKGGFGADDIYGYYVVGDQGPLAKGNRNLDSLVIADADGNPMEGVTISAINFNEIGLAGDNEQLVNLLPGDGKDNFIMDVNSAGMGESGTTGPDGRADLLLRKGGNVIKIEKEGYLPERWLWPQLNDQEYSWFRRLFEDPDFGQKYVDRWSELRTNVFATARVLARVDALAAQLAEAQKRNFARWPILGERVVPNHFVGDDYAQEIAFLKDWAAGRLAWIDRQFLPVPSASIQMTTNGTTRLATLTIASTNTPGQILVTLDGADPRAAGGGVHANATNCPASLPCRPGERLFARFKQGTRWSGPMVLPVP